MTFRRATPDDLEDVLGVIVRCDAVADGWAPPDDGGDRKRVAELLAASDHHNEVAEVDGRVVGYANLHERAGAAHLAYLFVDPEHQGQGMGTLLMEHALQEARRRGHTRAALGAAVANRPAREFYERAGWTDTGHRKYHRRMGLEMAAYTFDLKAP